MSSIQLENINKIKYLKSVLDRVSSYGIDVSSYFDELNTIIDDYEDDKKIELDKDDDKINLTMYSDPKFDLCAKLELFSVKIDWCILFLSLIDSTDSWNLDVNIDEVFSLVYNKIDSILENISDVDIQEKIVIRYYDLVLKKILKDYDNKVYEYLDEYNDIDKYVYLMDSIKRYLESKNIVIEDSISNYNLDDIIKKVYNSKNSKKEKSLESIEDSSKKDIVIVDDKRNSDVEVNNYISFYKCYNFFINKIYNLMRFEEKKSNRKLLNLIYNNIEEIDEFVIFSCFAIDLFDKEKLTSNKVSLENVNTYGMGKWLKFEVRRSNEKKYLDSVEKCLSLVRDTPWQFFVEKNFKNDIRQGEFYIFVDNDEKPHIIVEVNFNIVYKVRWYTETQEEVEEYSDVLLSFFNKNENVACVRRYLEEEKWNKRLLLYIKMIEEKTFRDEYIEYLINDVFYCNIMNKNQKYSLHNLEKLKNSLYLIKDKIAKYYNCEENEIALGDVEFKWESSCPYKVILGNADFRHYKEIPGIWYSKVTDLGNLQYIGGNAFFGDSKVTNLGNLQYIGGYVSFEFSSVTDLENLQYIGGNAYFKSSKVTDLGNLQYIGGNASFGGSKVTDLGNLQYIGGNASFDFSSVTDLGNLQYIGGNAYFEYSKITNLGSLQIIGRDVYFYDSNVTDLGSLQIIGRNISLRDSCVTDFGNLQIIGGNVYGRNVIRDNFEIRSLGNLRYVGGAVLGFKYDSRIYKSFKRGKVKSYKIFEN